MANVFLSSTFTELEEYRKSAAAAIDQYGHVCVRMETFPAADREISDFCRQKIKEAELVILLLGKLYGTLIPGSNISYTEYEFDVAVELRVPILVFYALRSAPTRIQEALDAGAGDYTELKQRQEEFLKTKALRGRVARPYRDPNDLKFQIGHSIGEHFRTAQRNRPRRYVGPMMPHLCDRQAQIDEFGDAFASGAPGVPQIYVVYGHELEQHRNCVRRLICYYINYPRKNHEATLVAPALVEQALVEWPVSQDDDDDEEILFRRLCRRLFQILRKGYAIQESDPAKAFCRLAVETKAPFLQFRHALRPEDWGPRVQSLCLRYVQFWDAVRRGFEGFPPEQLPRTLVFFEFRHQFTSSEQKREFKESLFRVFKTSTLGQDLVRRILPELPSVEHRDLDLWYERFERFLLPQYRNIPSKELFPASPLPMLNAERRLRQLLGMREDDYEG